MAHEFFSATRYAAAFFIALALAACSGGGGGGGSSSTPVSSPGSTSQNSSYDDDGAGTTLGGASVFPFGLQARSTTVTYPTNSAAVSATGGVVTGSEIDPTGTGSTITVSIDANGNVSLLQFNITTPSGNITETYSNTQSMAIGLQTLGNLAHILNAANATAGGNNYFGLGPNVLSYSLYGIWALNDSSSSGQTGVYAFGNPTPPASMPISGTATYNGTTIGTANSAAGESALAGTVQLQANFATANVTTTISNLQFQNVATSIVTAQPNLTGSAAIAGNQYSGTLSGGSLAGTQTGTFYGPTANETAGVWKVSGGGTTAIGSYGAHQ